MVINELYINGVLADLPPRFSVRLNRQLLHPAELNSKDAQASYTIELPASDTNNAALGYANIEETSNKFNRQHTARYCVNGIEIFNGFLKLTGIEGTYKANLYKAAPKTAKDVFGDIALNQLPEYRIPFGRFAESISAINEAARAAVQPAIFPFAMYGLLPKVPANSSNSYSPRTIWDNNVYLGMGDIPPSLNLLTVIRHMFESNGIQIRGTAFDDERLSKIYMSYKNKDNYVMPWNYGLLGRVSLSGEWDSIRNVRTGVDSLEKAASLSYDGNLGVYNVDLLNSTNGRINVLEDIGGNVLYKELADGAGDVFASALVTAPVAGYYKIEFEASVTIDQRNNWTFRDPRTGILHMSGQSSEANNNFNGNSYEIKVLRGRGSSDFGLNSSRLDGRFYLDNLPQNDTYNEENVPKYMPQVSTDRGQQIAVDLAQNKYILAGLHFGMGGRGGKENFRPFVNPRDAGGLTPSILFPKPAASWNAQETTERSLAVINNGGYWKYGRLNLFGNDEENPSANIDYSEGDKIAGRVFVDGVETVVDPPADTLILSRFPLARYFTYTVRVPIDTVQEVYIYNGNSLQPFATVPVVNGVATFDTSQYPVIDFRGYLSLYLKTEDYDVDGIMILGRSVNSGDSNPVGWELTRRYEMSLTGAPFNYVRRGQYDGAPAAPFWDGQGRTSLVVWLEAGELVTIASVSGEGRHQRTNYYNYYGLVSQRIKWRFSIEPYQAKKEWLKVSELGIGTASMSWNNATDFDTDSINLTGFLSADVKANEFIENIEKAFNLQLTQTGAQAFELNVKQSRRSISSRAIDLDTGLRSRANTPLGLPAEYRIGFTVDQDEEGYDVSKDDGGGNFTTSAIDGGVVEQKSFFSYNWFKRLTKNSIPFDVPVITKKEAWDINRPYGEAMAARYLDQPYRFWYYDGTLNELGVPFDFNGVPMTLAKVSNALTPVSELSYKNKRNTLLDNYFTLLIDASSHYTELDMYLSPEEYKQLNGSILGRYNSDLYYIAEIQGYDPTNRNKTKIKLIRKI